MSELKDSLLKCKVEGNTIFLPPISAGEISNYNDMRKALLNAGAKYKRNTFVFPNDAQPYIDRLMGGENVNIKKEFQFFGTPDKLADELVLEAQIEPHHLILEPSAGQGAIVKAIQRIFECNQQVDACELMDMNIDILNLIKGVTILNKDFLLLCGYNNYFDRIIANPPFNKNQDIDHIYKMYECLKPGGRITTIASIHWLESSNKKEVAFKNWLDSLSADRRNIDRGEFKESGTLVPTCMLIINKPA